EAAGRRRARLPLLPDARLHAGARFSEPVGRRTPAAEARAHHARPRRARLSRQGLLPHARRAAGDVSGAGAVSCRPRDGRPAAADAIGHGAPPQAARGGAMTGEQPRAQTSGGETWVVLGASSAVARAFAEEV